MTEAMFQYFCAKVVCPYKVEEEKHNITFATFLCKICNNVNWYMERSGSAEIARE